MYEKIFVARGEINLMTVNDILIISDGSLGIFMVQSVDRNIKINRISQYLEVNPNTKSRGYPGRRSSSLSRT